MGWMVEIRGVSEWAGALVSRHAWVPAIAGSLNQTGESDVTFDTWEGAQAAHDMVWDMLAREAGKPSPPDGVHLRIIEAAQ